MYIHTPRVVSGRREALPRRPAMRDKGERYYAVGRGKRCDKSKELTGKAIGTSAAIAW